MLEAYRQHVAERAALGIPPLPLNKNQVADLVDVLPDVLQDGDLLLMMGAGDIGHMSQHIAAHGFSGKASA